MFKLSIKIEINSYTTNNIILYSNNIKLIHDVRDNLYLEFLNELCIDYDLCLCDTDMRHSGLECPKLYINNGHYQQGWKLEYKEHYLFYIDIYLINHCGSEEIIKYSDIENGNLYNHYIKAKEKYKDCAFYLFIPKITCKITEVNNNIPSNKIDKIQFDNEWYSYEEFKTKNCLL